MMLPQRIRVITIAVIRRSDEILVFEGYDHIKGETFYRPLGGGIEFGEPSKEALRREFLEEINAKLTDLRYLATLENIFTVYDKPGHEFIVIYAARFADPTLYEKEIIVGFEDNGDRFKALWMPLNDFRAGRYPLYPTGLLALLENKDD